MLDCHPIDCSRLAPLSMESSRQEYWSVFSFPSPRAFPTQGLNPGLLHCRQILYHLSHQSNSQIKYITCNQKKENLSTNDEVVFLVKHVIPVFLGGKKKQRRVLFSLVGKVKEFSNTLIIYFTLTNIDG